MSRRPKHLAAGGGERPLFPAAPGRSERGPVEGSLTEGGVLHRIPGLVVWAVLMVALAALLLVAMAMDPMTDDQDSSHVESGGGLSRPAARLGLPGGQVQSTRPSPRREAAAAAPTPAALDTRPPENADARVTPPQSARTFEREEQ